MDLEGIFGYVPPNLDKDEDNVEETETPLTEEEREQEISSIDPCQSESCLLAGTFPVGIFNLTPKSMGDSLLGRVKEGGITFKLGKGKVKTSAVNAAYGLVEREFPQVSRSSSRIRTIVFFHIPFFSR